MNPRLFRNRLDDAFNFHKAGRLADAEPVYLELLKAEPGNFDVLHLYGFLRHQQGRAAEAVEILGRALAVNPNSPVCRMRLGLALVAKGDQPAAERHLRSALASDPRLGEGWEVLALCLKLQDRLDEAAQCHMRSVALRPAEALPWCNFGLTLSMLGRCDEALSCHERALAADPSFRPARFGRAQALQQCRRLPEAIAEYDRVIAEDPSNLAARSFRLLAMHYVDGIRRETLFQEHAAYGRAAGAPAARKFPNAGDPGKRLRVAFLSPDFREHACSYFMEPILRHLDRSRFEVLLYMDHFREDGVSARLRGMASTWRNFVARPGEEVEAAILADAPDILVELSGHSSTAARLPLLARRLAPVQVTYLGYPDTTGVQAMDYRLTDETADPSPRADTLATERLVRFSPVAWAYQPPADAPEVSPPPMTLRNPPTFGSFSDPSKLSASTLSLWAGLLGRVPGSRLLVKGAGLADKGARDRLAAAMAAAGIDPGRMAILGRSPTVAGHLALYAGVDVALDSSPYNGTTTTCEALWMGVPVVSLVGDRHVSRVGASLLRAAGHPEWVARTGEDYLRIASDLVAYPSRLSVIRAALRGEFQRSLLLDHAGQAERFGAALRSCWRACCSTFRDAPCGELAAAD